eukprot:TRINITY_DN231_c0_g1_i1.p1 TRINITY_DN231_c0_g1~~TRINITY_DN231_c0_g1_i1.p1  ORF type:complete len:1279 (+),score=278.22 TRINITY_DN231_c0_g1_i1:185-4021(+)
MASAAATLPGILTLCPSSGRTSRNRHPKYVVARTSCIRSRSLLSDRSANPSLRWRQGRRELTPCMISVTASKKGQHLLKEHSPFCCSTARENKACIRRQSYCNLRVQSEQCAPCFPQRRVPLPYFGFPFSQIRPRSNKICCPKARSNIVPTQAIGPDEVHAATTTWPETEKQGADFWEHGTESIDLEGFLSSKLPSHPKLYRGQLKNGLRYVILPNKVPPNRFEAHMEMHVGSVDEEEDEQGIAHMIEHVSFLGSKKREQLLGTGARSNAYTDFHHTVFHVHSPFMIKGSDESLLPVVLDALHEIAFQPKFLPSRVEKERRAVLSELQMMNTIEYRVDCQLLQQLHSENKLGSRFPIGLEEQIKRWDPEALKRFHERWYFPANATLYIVGDIDSVPKTVSQIDAAFGRVPSRSEQPPLPPPNAFGTMASFLAPKLPTILTGAVTGDKLPNAQQPSITIKERHAVRPPVKHEWSTPGGGRKPKQPYIFQHELLQNFSIHFFCKVPVRKVQTYDDLRDVLMKRIFLSALHFRINTRYKSSNPPFTTIELDHSDSGREGCTVSTLTVTAEPQNWHDAIRVAVQEVHRLKDFGVTKGELARYTAALIKDSEHLAAMIDNVPSIDNLDFVMESDALGHTVMDQRQGHECLVAVAETITLEDVNAAGAEVLEYVSDFGKPTAPLPAGIVACVPKTILKDGVGDVEFNIVPEDITASIYEGLKEPIEPEPELEVPQELISEAELESLWRERNPSFVPVEESGTQLKVFDKETGIVQLHLSNGIHVNYKLSQNEAKGGVMRLVVGGGRARESPDAMGAVVVGVRTLSEGGRVGDFTREQVELFCVNHLINCALEASEEFVCMEFHFNIRDGGMRAAFQLLHMVLEHNIWLEDAFERAKQLYISHYYAMPKSLERASAHRLMRTMLSGDERFVEPSPKVIKSLSLSKVKDAVLKQFRTDNMEVSIVGDFSEQDIESCVLDYLGTVAPSKDDSVVSEQPVKVQMCSAELRNQQVFLKDTDERACAYITGLTPNRWGFTTDGQDLNSMSEPVPEHITREQALAVAEKGTEVIRAKDGRLFWKKNMHPLYCCVSLTLLAEIINSRLFTTVRDSLGLTYDVSFELSLFDRLPFGWFVISVTSTPEKVTRAVDACKSVLQDVRNSKITQRELDRAKRTLLMRHETEMKSNAYWLGLLTHLQSPSVPRKNIACIRELVHLYETTTIDDVYSAYDKLEVGDESLFTCIGVAGSQNGDVLGVDMEDDAIDLDLLDSHQGVLPIGRGSTTMTLPTS